MSQFPVDEVGLSDGFGGGAVSLYDIACITNTLGAGDLARDSLQRFFAGDVIARDGSGDLGFLGARRDDELVPCPVAPGFDEDGGFDNRNAVGVLRFELDEGLLFQTEDGWVNDGIELAKEFRISEDDGSELFAVDGSVRVEELVAEQRKRWMIGFPIWHEDLVPERIGVDHVATKRFQVFGDKGLAAGVTAGEANAKHVVRQVEPCSPSAWRWLEARHLRGQGYRRKIGPA